MKLKSFRSFAVALSCVLVLLPQLAQAAAPSVAAPAGIQDVALQSGGVLHGHVLDPNGQRQVGATVTILRENQILLQTVTDEHGEFVVSGLSGGLYQIAVGEQGGLFRLWAPHTAPPVAKSSATLVDDSAIVRGKGQRRWGGGLLRNPWFWGAAVGLAIALPLALDRDDAS